MSKAQEHLGAWVRNHCGRGESIWSDALSVGPRFYLEHPDHHGLDTFYFHYGKWDEWVLELDAKLRSRVARPEAWIAMITRRFDLDRPLQFVLRRNLDGRHMGAFDLSRREVYTNGGQAVATLHALMTMCTEIPKWNRSAKPRLTLSDSSVRTSLGRCGTSQSPASRPLRCST